MTYKGGRKKFSRLQCDMDGSTLSKSYQLSKDEYFTHTTHMPLRISEKKNRREALSRAEGPFE
jgi:hypothetical protein